MLKKITCKSALNKNSTYYTPYKYDLNVYRGCEHKCSYCYALYSHKYLDDDKNFFDNIYYKENIAEKLDEELSKKSWQGDLIGFGTVCDSYQPAEKELKLARKCLEVMLKHKNSFYMSTKSTLILRDIDIIKELSLAKPVSIAMSIITTDDKIAKILEPNACTIEERFEMAKRLKEETNALVGIHLMPVIPFLTDSVENLESIIVKAKQLNLDFIVVDMLNLYGETRKYFFNYISIHFPNEAVKIKELYSDRNKIKEYNKNLHQLIYKLKCKHDFRNKKILELIEKEKSKQLSIFDDEN